MMRPVKGFRFAGISAGIKAKGGLDLALVAADKPATAAGVFTRNRVRAAPVVISERRLAKGMCQAVLVNSGNANACTGDEGNAAALALTRSLSRELGVRNTLVVPASTGVIGVALPTRRIEASIPSLVSALSTKGVADFSRAILTTDKGPKVAEASTTIGRSRCRVLGVAKGAGMIHPNMATTLAFVTTDASIDARFLRKALRGATEQTFNRATVDGDTSTNDSIYALASSAAGARNVEAGTSQGKKFEAALQHVLESLVKMIVADGEGAEHLVRIDVRGARTNADAVQIARAVAGSQLVKTAIHGADPNWGRIVAAAGRSGARFNPDHVSVEIGGLEIFRDGRPTMPPNIEAKATRIMRRPEYDIGIVVGRGRGLGHYWTCDLGHEYVRINADYRT